MLNNTTIAKVGQSTLWHILINFLWIITEKVKQWPRWSYRMHDEWCSILWIGRKKLVLMSCHCLYILKQTQWSSFQRTDSAQRYSIERAVEGYLKGIKVISQMNASAGDAKILVLLFQRTLCLTIPTVERRRFWTYCMLWMPKEQLT